MVDPRIHDLEAIKAVFDKYGVRVFLVYGALLGFHRDGDFLPGDDDIDLAVIDPIDHQTRKAIGWTLHDLGFYPQGVHTGQEIMFNVYNRMEPLEIGYNGDGETGIIVLERNFKFTIFFFKEEDCPLHGPEMVCTPKLGAVKLISSPSKFYSKPSQIKIGKKTYLTPGPIEDYLNYSYFNNWKDKTDRRHSDTYPDAHKK
jgi:hypothetical protein